ncbi:MAG: hydroxyacid dehydrogenase [Verrucomicrobiota bacterium]
MTQKTWRGTFTGNPNKIEAVYGGGRRQTVESLVDIRPSFIPPAAIDEHLRELAEVEVLFGTWGMPKFTPEQLDAMPRLRAVFYAAGSVRNFARPLLERGIVVASSWAANAIPVAEFTLAQILLSMKRYFRNTLLATSPEGYGMKGEPPIPGIFDETVALLGAGMIGRKVIELLKPFELDVVVYDPFLSEERAAELGVAKVSLEDAFKTAFVVSNHIANLPETCGMIKPEHFESMREGATFINTGRGATVDEPGMANVLARRTDLTALLDVTHPEPPQTGSPLYSLPNVQLSSHIAGSIGNEVMRMADYAIQSFKDWRDGKPLEYGVTLEMLEWMA